jgi:hypothetical protein
MMESANPVVRPIALKMDSAQRVEFVQQNDFDACPAELR